MLAESLETPVSRDARDSVFPGWRVERPYPTRKLSANLYDIYHRCVYSEKLLIMSFINI